MATHLRYLAILRSSATKLPEERAGLFHRLDDEAEPRFPAFLVRLLEELLDGSDHHWTLSKAEQRWFWGYLWEGAASLRDVYDTWLALACDIKFAEPEEGRSKAERQYRLVAREELAGLRDAASNWLGKEYPRLVEQMEDVFGNCKVRAYFDPQNGTETRAARKALTEAGTSLEALKVVEGSRRLDQPLDERGVAVGECARRRLDFRLWREAVRQIEARQGPPLAPEQAQTLVEKRFLKRTYTLGGSH